MRLMSAYLAGLLFGVGIAISGMMNPAKVLNFFDLAGSWDPSLALVMGGALATTALGYQRLMRRRGPVFASRFSLPAQQRIDGPLIWGAALFGVGWAVAGFCPGGALPALGTGRREVLVFVAALVAGILGTKAAQARSERARRAPRQVLNRR